MAHLLPHLTSSWAVDQAIASEEERIVIVRFGHDWDPVCMQMDQTLYSIVDDVAKAACIYLVDISEVPEFNRTYELYDPCTVMFFYRNKHILVDLGTGTRNKVNWALTRKDDLLALVNSVTEGAKTAKTLSFHLPSRFS